MVICNLDTAKPIAGDEQMTWHVSEIEQLWQMHPAAFQLICSYCMQTGTSIAFIEAIRYKTFL